MPWNVTIIGLPFPISKLALFIYLFICKYYYYNYYLLPFYATKPSQSPCQRMEILLGLGLGQYPNLLNKVYIININNQQFHASNIWD